MSAASRSEAVAVLYRLCLPDYATGLFINFGETSSLMLADFVVNSILYHLHQYIKSSARHHMTNLHRKNGWELRPKNNCIKKILIKELWGNHAELFSPKCLHCSCSLTEQYGTLQRTALQWHHLRSGYFSLTVKNQIAPLSWWLTQGLANKHSKTLCPTEKWNSSQWKETFHLPGRVRFKMQVRKKKKPCSTSSQSSSRCRCRTFESTSWKKSPEQKHQQQCPEKDAIYQCFVLTLSEAFRDDSHEGTSALRMETLKPTWSEKTGAGCDLVAPSCRPHASSPPFGSQICLCVCVSNWGSGQTLLKLGRGDWLVFGHFLNISRVVMVARALKLPNLQLGGSYFRLPALEKAMTSRLGGPTYWSEPAPRVGGAGGGGSGRVTPVVVVVVPLPWFRAAGRKGVLSFFIFPSYQPLLGEVKRKAHWIFFRTWMCFWVRNVFFFTCLC